MTNHERRLPLQHHTYRVTTPRRSARASGRTQDGRGGDSESRTAGRKAGKTLTRIVCTPRRPFTLRRAGKQRRRDRNLLVAQAGNRNRCDMNALSPPPPPPPEGEHNIINPFSALPSTMMNKTDVRASSPLILVSTGGNPPPPPSPTQGLGSRR